MVNNIKLLKILGQRSEHVKSGQNLDSSGNVNLQDKLKAGTENIFC